MLAVLYRGPLLDLLDKLMAGYIPWKWLERKVAKFLGGRRKLRHTGGSTEKDTGDVVDAPFCDKLFIECKFRSNPPKAGPVGWFDEAKEKAKELKRKPVLVVSKKGGPVLVIIEMKDFQEVAESVWKAARLEEMKGLKYEHERDGTYLDWEDEE